MMAYSNFAGAVSLALLVGCGGDWEGNPNDLFATDAGSGTDAGTADRQAGDAAAEPPVDFPRGLHVLGNRVVDAQGRPIFLRGVNRSGTEYRCIQGQGFFDGPSDEESVRVMATWKINAVRVPLNEACWLGTNGAPPRYALDNYKKAIVDYVALLHKFKLVPILDLHWAAPVGSAAVELKPMPNADHSPRFWSEVATTFLADTGVVFELYNEPFPDCNRDTDVGWQCWRDGCDNVRLDCYSAEVTGTYKAAGMQELVTAIRATGATQLILAGGLQYSNALSQWAKYKPVDPLNNLAPAWHVYNYNWCKTVECYSRAPAALAAEFPVVATEIGTNDCGGTFITPLMQFLDQTGAGYLAWSWNAFGACVPAGPMGMGQPYSLITNYRLGTPNGGFAQTFHDHLMSVVP